jgi:hypothetical protein
MKDRKFDALFLLGMLNLRKEFETKKVKMHLQDALPRYDEPKFKEVLQNTSSYIGFENCNMLLLNISKIVDFAQGGADGVVNAICFNCMLGTISSAISTQIREDFDNIPIPTLVYSGTDSSAEQTKLEAFVFQVQQFCKKRQSAFAINSMPERP